MIGYLVALLALSNPPSVPKQQVYLVFGKDCISKIEATRDLKLEVPLKENGQQDKKNARLMGVMATYDPGCKTSRVEIKREEK